MLKSVTVKKLKFGLEHCGCYTVISKESYVDQTFLMGKWNISKNFSCGEENALSVREYNSRWHSFFKNGKIE
jgi:hypothetical protein